MSDLDELHRIQADTQNMLDDIGILYGICVALAGAGVVGFIIWLVHIIF